MKNESTKLWQQAASCCLHIWSCLEDGNQEAAEELIELSVRRGYLYMDKGSKMLKIYQVLGVERAPVYWGYFVRYASIHDLSEVKRRPVLGPGGFLAPIDDDGYQGPRFVPLGQYF